MLFLRCRGIMGSVCAVVIDVAGQATAVEYCSLRKCYNNSRASAHYMDSSRRAC